MLECSPIDPSSEAALLFAAVSLAPAFERTERREEGGKGVWTTTIYHAKKAILEKLVGGECDLAWASPEDGGTWLWGLKFKNVRLTFRLAHSPEWLKATSASLH
jgi:hypothetical protein